ACVSLLVLVAFGLAVAGGLVRAHRSAQSAADLTALAAAGALRDGAPPCEVGASIAEANDARLTECAVAGREVSVVVVVLGPSWWMSRTELPGRARAGPERLT
ncbi:Rv3654c family TadE-like protein, partial [Nocardioides sp.]|uniref:Rv3654c family TadE-like protein n=1 Tax=Nocardioides sp. TaxID=35761 RepID=UPI00356259B7